MTLERSNPTESRNSKKNASTTACWSRLKTLASARSTRHQRQGWKGKLRRNSARTKSR
ncbi:hypothetical protein trd_0051 [Thermomicrobium roseum DSM 5159]|uniref:Uncharacterized protein n=1 Tax=Thermomicrobium roseum (strain ATCC 27502 / DSM 5159 / P-2) TaxID=309801 RepID=B9L269_THERP|nr:hypothetical protein trd_0051 [Thermomicrobium roseum DSM 5159]